MLHKSLMTIQWKSDSYITTCMYYVGSYKVKSHQILPCTVYGFTPKRNEVLSFRAFPYEDHRYYYRIRQLTNIVVLKKLWLYGPKHLPLDFIQLLMKVEASTWKFNHLHRFIQLQVLYIPVLVFNLFSFYQWFRTSEFRHYTQCRTVELNYLPWVGTNNTKKTICTQSLRCWEGEKRIFQFFFPCKK